MITVPCNVQQSEIFGDTEIKSTSDALIFKSRLEKSSIKRFHLKSRFIILRLAALFTIFDKSAVVPKAAKAVGKGRRFFILKSEDIFSN